MAMSFVCTGQALFSNHFPRHTHTHTGIVKDLTGYYNPESKTWYSVISLGREVCGFPRVVHGGLTAAMFDESFGGLLFSLKQQKALDFWGE